MLPLALMTAILFSTLDCMQQNGASAVRRTSRTVIPLNSASENRMPFVVASFDLKELASVPFRSKTHMGIGVVGKSKRNWIRSANRSSARPRSNGRSDGSRRADNREIPDRADRRRFHSGVLNHRAPEVSLSLEREPHHAGEAEPTSSTSPSAASDRIPVAGQLIFFGRKC